MNLDDTPQEAEFRGRARAWIAANAPRELEAVLAAASYGTLTIDPLERIAHGRAWEMKKSQAGFACPHFPKELGGGGLSPIERAIWQQEEGAYGQLSKVFVIGQGFCGPTILGWGSDAMKQARIPPLVDGREIWCQLFSEPAAGSDLAGLRTRALPAEDGSGDWIVNGQKIWTSNAQYADWGILLTRTDPAVPKHKGLTMFIVNIKTLGIEVRPIRQGNGASGFNEVFLTDVRISDAQRLGPVGQGWNVSLTTLMNERMSVGAGMQDGLKELLALCETMPSGGHDQAIDDPAIRSSLARLAVRYSGLHLTALRAMTSLSKGETPGPENSISKLVGSSLLYETASLALDLQGLNGIETDRETVPGHGRFQDMLLRSPGARIEGGTDEILRNIIAERVLGLPGEIRIDKNVPFNAIPTSGAAGRQEEIR